MRIRRQFTEEEGAKLATETTRFCRELAKAAASVIAGFDEDMRDYVTLVLQDATSLYSPLTADLIDDELKNLKGR